MKQAPCSKNPMPMPLILRFPATPWMRCLPPSPTPWASHAGPDARCRTVRTGGTHEPPADGATGLLALAAPLLLITRA